MPEHLFVLLFLISLYSSLGIWSQSNYYDLYKIGSVILIEQNNLNTKEQQQKSYCIIKYLHALGLLLRSDHQLFTLYSWCEGCKEKISLSKFSRSIVSIPIGPMKNNPIRNWSSSTMMIIATMAMIMYISVLRTNLLRLPCVKKTYIHFKTLLANIVVRCNIIFSYLSFSI